MATRSCPSRRWTQRLIHWVPLSILVFVFPIDWWSGLIILVTAPLIPFFMILIGKGAEKLNQRQWKQLARMSAHFLDMLQGLTTLKLFNTSIRENLLLANPAASEGALEQACRKAEIHDFITRQPDGYDTWVGEAGLKISGGQARRIAIARALLKDAPLLILDEPTEDLDAKTERAMLSSVMQLMEGRTVVLITHRLAGLSLMDSILVLDKGRVVERSSHTQLSTAGGHYQDLIGFLRELRDQ